MNLALDVNIIKSLPLEEGISRAGKNWCKRTYIGQTFDKFQKTVAFTFFGTDAINNNPIEEGSNYRISFDVESRSFKGADGNDRWSTSVMAYKAEKLGQLGVAIPEQNNQVVPQETEAPEPPRTDGCEEHRPFATQGQMDAKADAYFSQQPEPQQQAIPQPEDDDLPF